MSPHCFKRRIAFILSRYVFTGGIVRTCLQLAKDKVGSRKSGGFLATKKEGYRFIPLSFMSSYGDATVLN